MLFHSRTTQQRRGPHPEACECVRCVAAETVSRDRFARGDMRLNLDKTTYGTLDAVTVPASTKFVGSYIDPGEEVQARVAAANRAYYQMKTVTREDTGVSKRLKLRLYEGVVKPTLMHNLWTVRRDGGRYWATC